MTGHPASTRSLMTRRQLLGTAAVLGITGVVGPSPNLHLAARQSPPLAEASAESLAATLLSPPTPLEGEEALIEVFARSGIAVFDLTSNQMLSPVAEPVSPLSYSREQVMVMAGELAAGASRTAGSFDTLMPITDPAGAPLPPVSDLYAGYLAGGETSGAEVSRLLMSPLPPNADPVPATDLPVSTASIGLMTGEILGQLHQHLPVAPATGGVTAPSLPGLPDLPAFETPVNLPPLPELDGSACSNVQHFIASVNRRVLAVVDAAARVVAPIPLLGQIVSGIGKVIQLGISVVAGAIDTIIAPVMGVLRAVAAGLAIASSIVGTLSTWHVKVSPLPSETRLGVGALEVVSGDLVIDAGGADQVDWPPIVADCAAVANLRLPHRASAGSHVEVNFSEAAPRRLVGLGLEERVLDDVGRLRITYVTENETDEQAQGQEAVGIVTFTVIVERDDVRQLLNSLVNLLLAELPTVIAEILQPIVGPVVTELRERILDLARVSGTGQLRVTYHREPEPTPPAAATGDSCLIGEFRVLDPVQMIVGSGATGASFDGECQWEFDDEGRVTLRFLDLDVDFGSGEFRSFLVGEASGTYDLSESGILTIQFTTSAVEETTTSPVYGVDTHSVPVSELTVAFSPWQVACGSPVFLQHQALPLTMELVPI